MRNKEKNAGKIPGGVRGIFRVKNHPPTPDLVRGRLSRSVETAFRTPALIAGKARTVRDRLLAHMALQRLRADFGDS
jgi:hypothetical protein